MTLAEVIAALHAQLESVEGLRAVLDYEPARVDVAPLVYLLVDSETREPRGNVIQCRYRVRARLVLLWTDPQRAEGEMVGLFNAIPTALDATAPRSYVADVDAGWATIGGIEYRVADFYTTVVTHEPALG